MHALHVLYQGSGNETTLGYTSYTLTKLNEGVGPLCFVHFMAVLLAKVCVEIFKVAEGEPRWVGLLTKSQVADTLFNDVAVESGQLTLPHWVRPTRFGPWVGTPLGHDQR